MVALAVRLKLPVCFCGGRVFDFLTMPCGHPSPNLGGGDSIPFTNFLFLDFGLLFGRVSAEFAVNFFFIALLVN